MSAAGPLPLQWEINGLKLAGLSWGKPGDRPLLALHGWLDNAASFSLLAPLMTGYNVVALDLTGHVAAVLADLPGQRARLEQMSETENAASFVTLYDELERKWMAHEA